MKNTVLLLMLFLLAQAASAQNAIVSGRVLDTQQAAVPAADVVLINTATDRESRTRTNGEGRFLLPPATPGIYEIRASAPGFAVARLQAVTLEVGQSKVVTLELSPEAVKEVVVVAEAAPQLNTDRADRSVVMERTFVESIPLNVRNPLQLINFSVAVTRGNDLLSGTNTSSQSRTNTFRINGAKGATTDILIDGATNTTSYYNQAAGVPGVDTIQEYRVFTTPYAPEYGRTSGGVVSYAMRSGTNDVHGSVFEFLRNSALDANGFNSNKAALPKAGFRRNQFGYTLGGPVFLPRIYNGRNRTFFFTAYEGLRESSAGSFTGTMPTDLERGGDFSETRDANGSLIVVYDPRTTRADPAAPAGTTRYIRSAYAGNRVPAPALNPIAQKLLSYYPKPNQPGLGRSNTSNFFSAAPNVYNQNRVNVRLDHQISPHHTVYGHYDWFTNRNYSGNYYANWLAPVYSSNRIPGIHWVGHHTWSVSPAVILDHHISYAHSESNRNEMVHVTPESLGFPASIAPGITGEVTPVLSASRISSLGPSIPFERNKSTVWQYAASLSWLKGAHTFKFGFDFRHYPLSLFYPKQLSISAGNTFTGGPNPNAAAAASGNGIADLLLGAASVQSGYQPELKSSHSYYAGYAQDTIRLTRRLTLTVGLRYNYESGEKEQDDSMTYLDLYSPSPIASQVRQFAGLRGGVGIPGLNGDTRRLRIPVGRDFDPRAGLSFELNSKTVLHSGFGIFHHSAPSWGNTAPTLAVTRISTSLTAEPDGVTPLYSLSNPFPQGLPKPTGKSLGLATALGQNVSGPLRTQRVAYQASWSFDVQRQLPLDFVVTAAYVGNSGVNLMTPVNFNQLQDSALATGTGLLTVVANPFYGVITDPSSTLSRSTVQYGQLLRPFPHYLNFSVVNVPAGHSSYHAMQLTVERRFARGMAALFGYAFAKSIDNVGEMTSVAGSAGGFQNNNCYVCDRSRSDQNQTHTLRSSLRYELPFGAGRPFLRQGVPAILLGGWNAGMFFVLDTGRPLPVSSPNNTNSLGGGSGSMRPMATGQAARLPDGPSFVDNGAYFNPAAFTRTPQFAFGNVSRYLPDVDRPTTWNCDLLIEKTFRLAERVDLRFRTELFNAFNHTDFSGPVTDITNAAFGRIFLTQANTARQIQLGLRLAF